MRPSANYRSLGSSPQPAQRGLTLIEACVAMAIAAITLSTAAPGFASFLETRRIDGVAAQLAADVHFARSEAARRQSRIRLTLQTIASGTCWIVHTGSAAACHCSGHGPADCDGSAEALKTVDLPAGDHIAVQANVVSMLFDPLHGTSTPAGTLKVVASSGRTVQHVVNVLGRVRTCSPQGAIPAVPGYRVC